MLQISVECSVIGKWTTEANLGTLTRNTLEERQLAEDSATSNMRLASFCIPSCIGSGKIFTILVTLHYIQLHYFECLYVQSMHFQNAWFLIKI